MLRSLVWTIVLGEKVSVKFISVKDGPKKGQKQGRNERMQEDYLTTAKNAQQMYM